MTRPAVSLVVLAFASVGLALTVRAQQDPTSSLPPQPDSAVQYAEADQIVHTLATDDGC